MYIYHKQFEIKQKIQWNSSNSQLHLLLIDFLNHTVAVQMVQNGPKPMICLVGKLWIICIYVGTMQLVFRNSYKPSEFWQWNETARWDLVLSTQYATIIIYHYHSPPPPPPHHHHHHHLPLTVDNPRWPATRTQCSTYLQKQITTKLKVAFSWSRHPDDVDVHVAPTPMGSTPWPQRLKAQKKRTCCVVPIYNIPILDPDPWSCEQLECTEKVRILSKRTKGRQGWD